MKVTWKNSEKFVLGLILFQMRHVPAAAKIEILHITPLQILRDKYRREMGVLLLINCIWDNNVNFKTTKFKNRQ